jgi:cysteinyl-tRNA synthetase
MKENFLDTFLFMKRVDEDMALKLYNTLTRKKEEFKSIRPNFVTLYTCGPTVYNYVHIGNLRAMLSYDILKRYLKYKSYKVQHVMNITDIDDKTIRDSQKEGKTLKEFTEFYTKAFIDDIKTLNIDLPDVMPKATEEIDEMVKLVKILLEKGYAYRTENGDIYFKISKFEEYGKLALLDLSQLKKNAEGRLNAADEYEKEDARDFALWKAWDPKDGNVFWETEIGKGRPGWHIECSAMAGKHLGQPFDIHMGGIDLIFPHHTNEIAQSEAAYNKKFCNYWIHNEHLFVNGQKMSKSLGNFYTLRDLLNKGYDPMSIRYELISSHYRQQMDFRENNLENDKATLQKFKELFIKLDNTKEGANTDPEVKKLIETVKEEFEAAMDDDLNITAALAAIFTFIREINKLVETISKKDAEEVKSTLLKFDSVLGVMDYKKEEIPAEIKSLAEERLNARKEKNWKRSDELREEIKKKGFTMDDKPDGYILKRL